MDGGLRTVSVSMEQLVALVGDWLNACYLRTPVRVTGLELCEGTVIVEMEPLAAEVERNQVTRTPEYIRRRERMQETLAAAGKGPDWKPERAKPVTDEQRAEAGRLMREGLKVREIAVALGLAESTTSRMLTRIREEAGQPTKAEPDRVQVVQRVEAGHAADTGRAPFRGEAAHASGEAGGSNGKNGTR